jgi:PAS domain-containing protein
MSLGLDVEVVNMSDTNIENQLRIANTVEALQESEKRYRRLFESARDGILILDADTGKVVDVNPFLLQLLGYSYDATYLGTRCIQGHCRIQGRFQGAAR